jgi:hypothetical protein
VSFDVLAHERFLVQSETVSFEFHSHAKELSHNTEVFNFKGLETCEQIIDQVSAGGSGEQVIDIDPYDGDVIGFTLVIETKVRLAARVANGD